MSVKKFGALLVILVATLVLVFSVGMADNGLTPIEELGEFLYFDEDLSDPAGQSCASCHEPAFGFVDPDKGLPVSEGVIPGLFGVRNSPSADYAMYAPIFSFDEDEGLDNALKRLLEQTDLVGDTDTYIASIPSNNIMLRNLQMPFKETKKIRQTIAFELESMLPFPIEDLLIDFLVIDQTEQAEILSASVEREFFSRHLNLLQSSGIDPLFSQVKTCHCIPGDSQTHQVGRRTAAGQQSAGGVWETQHFFDPVQHLVLNVIGTVMVDIPGVGIHRAG